MSLLVGSAILTACGGGGNPQTNFNYNNNTDTETSTEVKWVAGEFTDYDQLAKQCEADGTGSALAEKLWQRSYSNDTYLWYDEIPDEDPAPYSILEYFDILKTSALTPSGKLKDQFHFTMPTEEWEQLTSSGSSVGFGFNIKIEQGSNIDRTITVTFNEPDSPAFEANINRGAKIIAIDGVNVATANDQASINVLNNGLFPSEAGQETIFVIRDFAAEQDREVTLTAQSITSDPVPLVDTIDSPTGKIGYVIFNDHIATAEKGLYDAFNELEPQNIDELIVDFRYNGGGYLAIASQLGYMVAGAQTENKTFETTIFNDKYPNTNPITGRALSPTPFYDETLGINTSVISAGLELPTLNLNRVFVLTSANTCSASEAFINGLRGIDVEVIQIGSTTCGKPYGFYAADNCETTYFTVQFKGENSKGFGDYADGFSPSTVPMLDTEIQGCAVADDLSKPLGDVSEGMLSAALYYAQNNACPETPIQQGLSRSAPQPILGSEFKVQDTRARAQLLSNRIMTK